MRKPRKWSSAFEALETRSLMSVVGTEFTGRVDAARGVAVEKDGTVVVAGIGGTSGNVSEALSLPSTFALAFYSKGGKLIRKVQTGAGAFGGYTTAGASSVAIQHINGKDMVIAGGFVAAERPLSVGFGITVPIPVVSFAMARYDSSGHLDPSFGHNGTVVVPLPTTNVTVSVPFLGNITAPLNIGAALGVAVRPDGQQIVLAGTALTGVHGMEVDLDVALAGFTKNGALDPSFGGKGDGLAITHFSNLSDAAAGVIYQPVKVGKSTLQEIVIAGAAGISLKVDPTNLSGSDVNKLFDPSASPFVGTSSDGMFALARYKPNGTLDRTFGTSGTGLVTTNLGRFNDAADAIALDPITNQIVAAGVKTFSTKTSDIAVVKYSANGVAQVGYDLPSFKGFGDSALGVVVKHDQTIVAVGEVAYSSTDAGTVRVDITKAGKIVKTPINLLTGPQKKDVLGGVAIGTTGRIIGSGFIYQSPGNTQFVTLFY